MNDARPPADLREPRTQALLWFVFLAGPLAWSIGLLADYALVRVACADPELMPLLHLVTVATLALAAAGGWVGWREWGRAGRRVPGEGGDVIARTRFMSAVGVGASVLFAVVIVVQWAAKLALHPCMGI